MPQKPDPQTLTTAGRGIELKDIFYGLVGIGIVSTLVASYIKDSQNTSDLPVLKPNQIVTTTVEDKYCKNATPFSQPRIVTEPNEKGQPTKYAIYCPR